MTSPGTNDFPALNSYFASLCVIGLLVLFLGLAFGSFLKNFIPSKKRRKITFSSICIFLTVSIILYTVLIFINKNLFPIGIIKKSVAAQGVETPYFYVYFGSIFVWGVLISFWWKLLLPVTIAFYFGTAFYTNHLLYKIFGEQPESIPLSIDQNSTEIKLTSFVLPDILLLPVKRNWFLVDAPLPQQKIEEHNRLVRLYIYNVILIRAPREIVIQPPKETVFPSLYSLKIKFQNGFPKCEMVRVL